VRLHLRRLLIGALILVAIGAAATLAGWDISSWFKHIWDTITGISPGYLVAGIALLTLETTATAYAWYSILRYGYPDAEVRWIQVLACYAAAVALNSVLPANLGTFAMLLMFTTIVVGATLAGVLAGMAVQKIFFTAIGTFCYLYLFLTVGGSFSLQLGFVSEHPWATAILAVGGAALIVLVGRVLRRRMREWWAQAKVGAQILAHPRAFFGRVVLPEAIAWLAMLGVIAVFLAAYEIPVSFHTLMRVVAGNSIANVSSVTPGGAGVVQGFNVLSLKGITSASNATAYSVSQQLVTTAWGILFAIVLLIRAFGWSDGKTLVVLRSGAREEGRALGRAQGQAPGYGRAATLAETWGSPSLRATGDTSGSAPCNARVSNRHRVARSSASSAWRTSSSIVSWARSALSRVRRPRSVSSTRWRRRSSGSRRRATCPRSSSSLSRRTTLLASMQSASASSCWGAPSWSRR
jgi:uncharacterized membrane protein YbhN (UPF0104 family)